VIPAGTLLLANTAAANRDPDVYDGPDRLDITRDGAPAMQTFGGGMHYCLGAHLARLELAEALAVMTTRMPNARRTGPAPWEPLTAERTDHVAYSVRHQALKQDITSIRGGMPRERVVMADGG
jgi:cytochrome P450